MTEHPARTPYCTKIRYGITGAPETTGMEGSYASGLSIDPTLVELVYSTAREGRPASLSASVRGWVMRNGARINPDDPDDQMLVYFKNGPHGWPAWLTEEARLHDPAAATVPASAPVGQAALYGAAELEEKLDLDVPRLRFEVAEFELRGTGEIRAAALTEAADFLRDAHFNEGLTVQEIGTALRHWADRERADAASGPGRADGETQQDETNGATS